MARRKRKFLRGEKGQKAVSDSADPASFSPQKKGQNKAEAVKSKLSLSPEDEAVWQAFSAPFSPLKNQKARAAIAPDLPASIRQFWKLKRAEKTGFTEAGAPVISGRAQTGIPFLDGAIAQDGLLPAAAPSVVGNHFKNAPSADFGLERRLSRRIEKGHVELEHILDLHGLNEAQAYALFEETVIRTQKQGAKTLLVITGKGGRRYSQSEGGAAFRRRADFNPDGGVLKRALPLWLESPTLKGRIERFAPAGDRHGGAGAFYIRLRRKERL